MMSTARRSDAAGNWLAPDDPIQLAWPAGELANVLDYAKADDAVVLTAYPRGLRFLKKPGYPTALELAKWLREQDPSAPVWADVACGGMVIALRIA